MYTLEFKSYMSFAIQWHHPIACVLKLYFDYLSFTYDLLIAFYLI